jgi:hypothetical protein
VKLLGVCVIGQERIQCLQPSPRYEELDCALQLSVRQERRCHSQEPRIVSRINLAFHGLTKRTSMSLACFVSWSVAEIDITGFTSITSED